MTALTPLLGQELAVVGGQLLLAPRLCPGPQQVANLDFLCRKFSIDASARTLHGALLDCQLLAEVYIELIGGKQTALEFFEPEKNIAKTTNINQTYTKNITKITLTEKEKESHKEFTKNLKNTLWKKLDY